MHQANRLLSFRMNFEWLSPLLNLYHRSCGLNGTKRSPLKNMAISALGLSSLGQLFSVSKKFDWHQERLSISNFNLCVCDIEFIETLSENRLCKKCKALKMKYCFCLIGNRDSASEPYMKSFQQDILPFFDDGNRKIEMAGGTNWEPYFQTNDILVWKREEVQGTYSYKVYARFDDICAEDLHFVQTDLDYRHKWDKTVVKLHLIEEDPKPDTNSHLIYWEMRWPKLFANRDYVFVRRFMKDEEHHVIVICSCASQHPKYPVRKDKVRIKNYWSLILIKPYGNFKDPGVHLVLTYYDDPGIVIPQSIKTWVTQGQMPDFVKKMHMATKNYSKIAKGKT